MAGTATSITLPALVDSPIRSLDSLVSFVTPSRIFYVTAGVWSSESFVTGDNLLTMLP